MTTQPQDTPSQRVVLDEALQLQATRDLLKAAARRIERDIWQMPARDAYDRGKLVSALESAETAVFNAINTAYAYCDCAAATKALSIGGIDG